MIMRSFENQIRDSITTMEITASTKTVSPCLMPDVQYEYIQKFTKCFLVFENPFIILSIKKYHFYVHQLHFYLLEQF